MAPSVLILSILEQAKEPLLCLNGTGYFSEAEWVQLDLIMNKKYVWTTGPKSRYHNAMKAGQNANEIAGTDSGDSSTPASEQGASLPRSSNVTSSGTSLAPSLGRVRTSSGIADSGWELPPALNSPARTMAMARERNGSFRSPQTNEFTVGYTRDPFERPLAKLVKTKGMKQSVLPPAAQRKIAAWVSAARNGLPEITPPQLSPASSRTLVLLDDIQTENSAVSKRIAEKGQCKDVNAFATNYRAGWSEEPVSRGKSLYKNGMKVVFEEKAEKVKNIAFQESQTVKAVIHGSLPHTPPISPQLEDDSMQNTVTVTQSIRQGNTKVTSEPKDRTYIPPLPKTKTCWFWAESVGGCRYRPEECLNIHDMPKPGTLPDYPLKDGKPTWGCLADATPQEVPEGKKPLSCWYWATKGACQHGAACGYVHGWVKGGVARRPKHVVVGLSDEKDGHDSEEENDDCVDLSGRDVGDKAPSEAFNMTPSFIASRIHTLG